MMKLAITTLAATGIAAATLALAAPAIAAPSPSGGSVQDTVNSLQAQGFKVIVNKIGSAPLDQCTVASVRPGQKVIKSSSRDGGNVVQQSYTTVYVQAQC